MAGTKVEVAEMVGSAGAICPQNTSRRCVLSYLSSVLVFSWAQSPSEGRLGLFSPLVMSMVAAGLANAFGQRMSQPSATSRSCSHPESEATQLFFSLSSLGKMPLTLVTLSKDSPDLAFS